MKVLLVDTSQLLVRDQGHSNTGMLILSAILRDNNIQHESLSLTRNETQSFEELGKEIISFNSKIICFNAVCFNLPYVLKLAENIKKIMPETKIILGGIEATLKHRLIIRNFPYIDCVFKYSAETTFIDLINNINDLVKVKGITFRKNGLIVDNPACRDHLFYSPYPNYSKDPFLDTSLPARIEISRGCPYKCSYCSTSKFWGNAIRERDIGDIIREIIYLKKLGFRRFKFSGDSVNINRMDYLLDKIIELKISFGLSTRIEWINEKILQKLKVAGCEYIYFGIESGSEKIQQLYEKNIELDAAFEKLKLVAENGISPKASFIIGHPEEDVKDLNDTLRYLTRIKLIKNSETQIYRLAPLYGTKIFEKYKPTLELKGNSFISPIIDDQEIKKLILDFPLIFSSFYTYHTENLDSKILDLIQESYAVFAEANPGIILNSSVDPLKLFLRYLEWEKETGNYCENVSEFKTVSQHFFDAIKIQSKIQKNPSSLL